jgi:hypothetical protein
MGSDAPAEEGVGDEMGAFMGDGLGKELFRIAGHQCSVVTHLPDSARGLTQLACGLAPQVEPHLRRWDAHAKVSPRLRQKGIRLVPDPPGQGG